MIQLLKSVSIKSFVSTEAAHSTAAFQPVKLFFENFFSTQSLAASPNLQPLEAGGESYSVNFRCQPPFSPPRSIRPRHQQRHNLRPASAAHSTRIRHLCNPFQLSNLLIQKAFLLQFAAKVVRIIG
ncbi:hypothetical protein, partial [Stutzerimonas balearica]|uniref:hypothetical protein n=1 Tax=Stutzerimonas balearica TaxID=74829 RepID=UPI001F5226E5